MAWQFRAGRWIWKKRRPILKYGRRALSFEKTRRRAVKYRRKAITKKYTKSKGKSRMTSFTGKTAKSRKPMRAPSAQTRSKKPKFVRYRKGGCPPGYVYDPKRKMCIHKSYR